MTVRAERRGRVTVVTIDRVDVRNAVDRATAAALADAFRAFDDDDLADVAVLAGAGGTFCAGADLKAFHEDAGRRNVVNEGFLAASAGAEAGAGDGPMGPTRMLLRKPVIAAISGYAVAGGLELALWCDLRVVESDAVMGVFCRRFGVPLIDGGTVRLPRLIGLSRALDLILTGRAVDAEEAKAIGLANRVVPPGAALSTAIALAEQLASLPQTCLREDRLSAYEQHDLSFDDAMRNELRHGLRSLAVAAPEVARFVGGAGRHGAAAPKTST